MLHTAWPAGCGGITGAAVSRYPRIPTLYQGSGESWDERNMWTVVHDFHAPASEKPALQDFYELRNVSSSMTDAQSPEG